MADQEETEKTKFSGSVFAGIRAGEKVMPEQETIERAREDKREGKAPSTQAGEFVREEIHHVREGKHGARSTKQAIAIGLSKARRAGVDLPPPEDGASEDTREQARRDIKRAKSTKKSSRKRAMATRRALKREPRSAATKLALSRQAKKAASKRSKAERSASAKKAARTRKK
jgi:Family of unknown function (DUF6496)